MKPSAKAYLNYVQARLFKMCRSVDSIALAADTAAERIVTGGKLYGLGDDVGFKSEYSSRAGGLMGISTVGDDVAEGDVVVAATTGADDDYRETLAAFRDKGALIILIGSTKSKEKGVEDLFIDNQLPAGLNPIFTWNDDLICPTAGVCNVAALWTFVAEFISACTRRGKMPVSYQSGNMDAGRVRNTLMKGRIFHEADEVAVTAVRAGEKGREYLYNILRCFSGIEHLEIGKFKKAGSAAASALKQGGTVWCDVIGHHLKSQRGIAGDPGLFSIGAPESKETAGPLKKGDVYIFNGYFIFPGDELEKARNAGVASFWLLGGRETQDIYPQPGEIHIDAQWRYGDASLAYPGCDIRVVPPSGVIMTATLWMLTAETAKGR